MSKNLKTYCQHDFPLQEAALRGEIDIETIAPWVHNFDNRHVAIILTQMGIQLPKETIRYMCRKAFGSSLIPVAGRNSLGESWPTILVPFEERFLDEDEADDVLEFLREWKCEVEKGQLIERCPVNGWIGGIVLPHPKSESQTIVRWPWRHRCFDANARPGNQRMYNLFGVVVETDGRSSGS